MPFLLIGVNHKTCPLEVREKFFLQAAEKELLLAELKNDPKVLAAFVLSTCNRTEIYTDLLESDPASVLNTFLRVKHLPLTDGLEDYFYVYRDEDVVSHLFRVVTGLDSLILGEKQILGQVKGAVACAQEKKTLNRAFNLLSNMAIETGRKIRRETHIDYGGASVSWAAVSKAKEIFGTLEGKNILLMGCGKMGALASEHLIKKGVNKIQVINRTHEKAEELARQCGGVAVPFWHIKEALEDSDICICSTGAPHYLVDRDLVERVMVWRPRRVLALIDIAVPRNIDPHVAGVENVVLVSVDELTQDVQKTMEKRGSAVELAERIIRTKTEEFYRKIDKAVMYEHMNARKKEARVA